MGSPSAPSKPPSRVIHSRPSSTRAKPPHRGLTFPSTPPLVDSDKALAAGTSSGTLRSKRSLASIAAKSGVVTTRAGLRSSRGPNSDAAASGAEEGKDESNPDNIGPMNDGDMLVISKPVPPPPVTPPVLVYSNPGRYWQ